MIAKPSGKDRIIVALDVPTSEAGIHLAECLAPFVGGFKIGFELFVAEGPIFVRKLTERGANTFLDLKFHDIPNTVRSASREAAKMGVQMFNVHASGGRAMMRAALEGSQEGASDVGKSRPFALGVTVLTSLDDNDLREIIGHSCESTDMVRRLAMSAREAGLDGVIASPKEATVIRADCGDDFLIVVPGVRPVSSDKDDQKRTLTPRETIEAGADYMVIGRPIRAADNPASAARAIAVDLD